MAIIRVIFLAVCVHLVLVQAILAPVDPNAGASAAAASGASGSGHNMDGASGMDKGPSASVGNVLMDFLNFTVRTLEYVLTSLLAPAMQPLYNDQLANIKRQFTGGFTGQFTCECIGECIGKLG